MEAFDFSKEIPPWINLELLNKAIQSEQNDPQAEVTHFKIYPATRPGDNFASAIFCALIKFTTKFDQNEKELSVIIKTQPVNVDLPNMEHMTDTTLFQTEMAMYSNVLCHIQELMESAGYDDVVCPRLIYQTMSPKPVIILEDVQQTGFDTMITSMHKNFELSKMLFRKLAKFHAAGFHLHDQKKIDATKFEAGFFKIKSLVKMIYDESFDVLFDVISDWNEFEEFIEPLKKFEACLLDKAENSFSFDGNSSGFNVLNHGDFHMKNILYKMKENDVEDLMMIDFQIAVYASSAVDLSFAFLSFVSDENRFSHHDELLAVYHTQFCQALNKFGCLKKPPTLLDLQTEMMSHGHLMAQNIIFVYPNLIADIRAVIADDPDAGSSGRKLKMKLYRNERYRKVLKQALTVFLQKGYLTS